ncbi:hypothetical protein ThvES_00007960 [Thiovulum sp. ES]|nr:hypothetical protein ThvES_00007960 [Thiovulum sp. ES]
MSVNMSDVITSINDSIEATEDLNKTYQENISSIRDMTSNSEKDVTLSDGSKVPNYKKAMNQFENGYDKRLVENDKDTLHLMRNDIGHPILYNSYVLPDRELPFISRNSKVKVEAVHPHTKAFEGRFSSEQTTSTFDPSLATKDNPYIYSGDQTTGPRMHRGGLAGGWSGTKDGQILKITSPETDKTQHWLSLVFNLIEHGFIATNRLRFSFYVRIEKGSFAIGTDSGYNSGGAGALKRGRVFSNDGLSKYALDCVAGNWRNTYVKDTGQGWYYVNFVGHSSRVVNQKGSAHLLGFSYNSDDEIYIALPQVYTYPQMDTSLPTTPNILTGHTDPKVNLYQPYGHSYRFDYYLGSVFQKDHTSKVQIRTGISADAINRPMFVVNVRGFSLSNKYANKGSYAIDSDMPIYLPDKILHRGEVQHKASDYVTMEYYLASDTQELCIELSANSLYYSSFILNLTSHRADGHGGILGSKTIIEHKASEERY